MLSMPNADFTPSTRLQAVGDGIVPGPSSAGSSSNCINVNRPNELKLKRRREMQDSGK